MKLLVKKLRPTASLPQRQTEFSGGYDLCACLEQDVVIPAGETAKIPPGIALELQGRRDVVMLIYARSSLATRFGIAPANCVGVVDWDYRGEIIVALHNSGREDFTVHHGDRVAQLVITPVLLPDVEEAETLSDTQRGAGGFGSTGKN